MAGQRRRRVGRYTQVEHVGKHRPEEVEKRLGTAQVTGKASEKPTQA